MSIYKKKMNIFKREKQKKSWRTSALGHQFIDDEMNLSVVAVIFFGLTFLERNVK